MGTLTAGTLNDIGQHTVTLEVYQDIDNPDHGYNAPLRGIMESSFQTFTLTIKPCTVNSIESTEVVSDITYNIGDAEKSSGAYKF